VVVVPDREIVAARRPVTTTRVHAVDDGRARVRPDRVVTEEPMEIRVHGPGQAPAPLAVTMRTPGHDFELAVGFCLTEGVIARPDEVAQVAYCLDRDRGAGAPGDVQHYNVVTVRLRHPVDLAGHERRFAAGASCGLCGKTTLEQVATHAAPIPPGLVVGRTVLVGLPARLREQQSVFDATGGLHACARFDPDGGLAVVREDVGRHNALDKLVGEAALTGGLPLASQIVMVSGRVSFEIVQKAVLAGAPVLCAVSAPSSLAVATADRLGQTLVGFLRGDRFNIYTHPERIDLDA